MVTEAGDQYGSFDQIRQRLAAVDVMARYAAGIDRADWPLVESCFDPAAHVRGTRMEARFAEYFPVLRVEIEKFERTFHFLGNQRVRLDDQSTWLETYAVARHFWTSAHGEPKQMTIGVRYFDEFRRSERGWVIADRAVDLDWTDTNPPSAGVTWTVPDRGRESISEVFG
jgi:hypothetical protein